MELVQGRTTGARGERRSGAFTGEVWGQPLVSAPSDGVVVNTVEFAPGARSHWHRHEHGQVLHVSSGEGWVGVRGQAAERIAPGAVVWAPPGEEHWHGASVDAALTHVSISLGRTERLDEVSDEDYRAAASRGRPGRQVGHSGHGGSELFEQGLEMRRSVLGAEHVERSMAAVSDFSRPVQELVTEYCWGAVWTRPGLDLQTRSLLNLVMLTALNRSHELAVHVRGAVTNGCTREQVREALLQTLVYCGAPAALEAFRVAERVLDELETS